MEAAQGNQYCSDGKDGFDGFNVRKTGNFGWPVAGRVSWMKSRRGEILISNCCRSVGERKWKEEGEVFTLKVQFDRTALFYCKLRKQSVKDSWIKSSPH
jgi:hypothetical protein